MQIVIVGGGIGGLSLALALRRGGVESVDLYEADSHLSQPGVGLLLQPAAMVVLDRLGVGRSLRRLGLELDTSLGLSVSGREVWRRPVGTAAGAPAPQLAIHRGRLAKVLLDALEGDDLLRLHLGHRLVEVDPRSDGVVARFETGSKEEVQVTADLVVGADGARSTVRGLCWPDRPAPRFEGYVAWRGLTTSESLAGGTATVLAGHSAKVVWAFPVSTSMEDPSRVETTWVAHRRLPRWRRAPEPGWAAEGDVEDLIGWFEEVDVAGISAAELIRRSEAVYQHPVLDHPEVTGWTRGRVTLLGDAAHPLPPVGSVGASLGIVDAAALAEVLEHEPDADTVLGRYEETRRQEVAPVVELAAAGGPIAALDAASEGVDAGEVASILDRWEQAAGIQLGT